jgi:hypothetical protein
LTKKRTTTFLISRPQACRLLGVSDRTFARLEAEGVVTSSIPRRGRRAATYDGYSLVPVYLAQVEKKLHGDRLNAEQQGARRDRTVADLNELKLAEQRGALVRRDQVIRDGKTLVLACRAHLLRLPHALGRAGVLTPGGEATARTLVRDALSELARMPLQDLERLAQETPDDQDRPATTTH